MKRIPLTQGKFALVDDCDFEALTEHKWFFLAVGYAVRNAKKSDVPGIYRRGCYRGMIYMHRAILDARPKQEVDHINFDKLDNRRCNIRIASSRQNKCNRPLKRNNTSGFTGVSWAKRERRWVAFIHAEVGRHKVVGYFRDKHAAYAARCAAAKKCYGEFANV